MMSDILALNFFKLLKVAPDLSSIRESAKSVVSGYMDLNLDILLVQGDIIYIALSHYYRHESGDMIPDPDMELEVNFSQRTVIPKSYQDAYSYHYLESENCTELLNSLSLFLSQWLTNLFEQGHRLRDDD